MYKLGKVVMRLELTEPSQHKITHLLSRIVHNLLSKLAYSKQKVVESAEVALLSLFKLLLHRPSFIVNATIKRVHSKENKGGHTVKAMLHFLEHLVAEGTGFLMVRA